MKSVVLSIVIDASKEAVWKVITDIENSANNITGINKIEILEQPESGFIGLKWEETRTMFGRTATEIMWITDSEPHRFYTTRAESHGAIYKTRFDLVSQGDQSLLTMTFEADILRVFSKLMAFLTGWVFSSVTKKALMKDLVDIKAAAEKQSFESQ